jgi:hypothetical protein
MEDEMNQPEVSAPAPSKRRRWPFVVGALLLALLVVVALAPSMLGGFAARTVSSGFGEDFEGRLEIEELELSWTSRQALRGARLLDPDGKEVARVSVDLPSLLDLATSGGAKLGKVSVRASAELVADDAGVTNLDRALAPRPGREPSEPDSEPSSTDLGELLRALELEFDVVVERLSWSDATTRAAGKPFAIDNLTLLVKAEPGQPLRVNVDGALTGLSSGALSAKLAVHDLFKGAELNPAARFEVDAALDSLPSALVDTLARQDGLVAMALGPDFRVTANGAGTLTEGKLQLQVAGRDGKLEFRGELADGVLGGREATFLQVALKPQAAALERVLASKLPEGVALAPIGAPSFDLLVEDLRVEVKSVLEALNAGGDIAAAGLGATRASLVLRSSDWRASGSFAPQSAGVEARGIELRAGLKPTEGRAELALASQVDLAGAESADETSRLTLSVDCPNLAQALALAEKGELSPTKLEVKLSQLPLALLNSLAPDAKDTLAKLPAGAVAIASTVELQPSKPAAIAVVASLGEGAQALALSARASIADPLGIESKRPEGALPPLDAQLELQGTEALRPFLSEDLAATVLELLGPSIAAQVSLKPASGSIGIDDVQLTAKLDAARIHFASGVRLKAQVLEIDDATPLTVKLEPSAAMVDRYLAESLPEGAKFAFTAAEPELSIALSELELPLGAFLGEPSANPPPLSDTVRATSAKLRVDVPELTYTQPPVAGASGAVSVPIAVERLHVLASLAGAKPAVFQVRGGIAGAKASEIELDAKCLDLGALLDALSATGEGLPQIPASAAVEISGDIQGLPTALVDALAAQEGLLVDVLGPEMNLKLSGAWPSGAGDPLRAQLTSSTASFSVEASLDGTLLRSQEGTGIVAKLPLSPLFSERIVGKLVPLCVNASKAPGSPPVGLSVQQFELPLDGDLRKLNALVELDLGEFSYDLLPGLSSTLAPLGLKSATQRTTKLDKLSLPIKDGVVSYDRLPISIEGHDIAFRGAFDLATLEYDLSTTIPLEALGAKFSSELDKVRKYLDPKLQVPLQLKGTWKSPKLRISDDFTKKVLRDAAEKAAGDALKGGLQDLLGGGKKKDN